MNTANQSAVRCAHIENTSAEDSENKQVNIT